MFALLALLAAQDIPPPPSDKCSDYTGVGYGIGFQPSVPRQGETVELIPMFVKFHGMPREPVPPECARDWQVKGEGVKLLRGGKLKIDAKAVAGSQIQFSAQIGGKTGRRGYGGLTVIAADAQVLSGTFRVVERGTCTGNASEIRFNADGSYNYTRPEDMFETKVSGAGRYTWDAASGRMELHHDDGRLYQRGTARWTNGLLVLDDIDPGGPMISDYANLDPDCHLVLASG